MNRFYLAGDCVKETSFIDKEEVHHMVHVMRMKVGDTFEIFDQKEQEYIAEITSIDNNRVNYRLLQEVDVRRELPVRVHIYQGLPKSTKMELILQKCTELGMYSLTPVDFERCVVNLKEKESKKLARWQKIVDGASKQSKRQHIPSVESIVKPKTLVKELEGNDLNLVLYELEKEVYLKDIVNKLDMSGIKDIGIVIGPEGGLEAEEVDLLLSVNNTHSVSLGDRILRTETVGIYMMSVLSYLIN